MKRLIGVLSLLVLAACGNPHLNDFDDPLNRSRDAVRAPFREIVVTTLDGGRSLYLRTNRPSINGPIDIRNPNTDSIIVEYRFEKGINFRWNGGKFPGTNGTCLATQLPDNDCRLDVEFHADAPGIYRDNLIATYALRSRPDDVKTKIIPLVGERYTDPTPIGLNVRPGRINFGTAPLRSPLRTDRINIENQGPDGRTLDIVLVGGAPFAMTHNCPRVLTAGYNCTIDVTYSSQEEGQHADIVRLTHSVNNDPVEVVDIPVTGETTGLPQRPGELVLADLTGRAVDFGTVLLGGTSQRTVEIRNIGELSATITDLTLSDDVFTFTGGRFPGTNGTCATIVLPASNCTIDLTFKPVAVASTSGALTIDYDNRDLTVGLTGAGRNNNTEVCYQTDEVVVNARVTDSPRDVILPYLPSARGTRARLDTLYGTATNYRVPGLKLDTVRNAQVFVSYEIPRLEGEVIEVNVDLNTSKVNLEGNQDTESICMSSAGIRKCSGRDFLEASFRRLRNPAFWSPITTPVNSRYEDVLRRGTSRCGSRSCSSVAGTFSADEWFELSAQERATLSGSTLSLVFVDDTRLITLPSLKLKTKKQVACK